MGCWDDRQLRFVAAAAVFAFCAAARGQIIVDQPPNQSGGPASDTEFLDPLGFPSWQQEADDVRLTAPAAARQITFWGFYDRDNPPATETMRIRWYAARPGDGLPGSILREQTFLNPSRSATGRRVFVGVDPHEYQYQVDLAAPFPLAENTTYWLEIIQLNDLNSAFRWEFTSANPEHRAFLNGGFPDWRLASPGSLSFQLSTVPEPITFALIATGVFMICKRLH